MIQIIRLLIPAFILCGFVLGCISCNNKPKAVVRSFGPVSMVIPDKYHIKKHKKEGKDQSFTSWKLVCPADSFQISYANLEKIEGIDTLNYGFGTKVTISPYEMFYPEFPPKDWKKDEFEITYPVICGSKSRLLSAKRKLRFMSDNNGSYTKKSKTIHTVELCFKEICGEKNMFCIFAESGNETMHNDVLEAIKTISFTCK